MWCYIFLTSPQYHIAQAHSQLSANISCNTNAPSWQNKYKHATSVKQIDEQPPLKNVFVKPNEQCRACSDIVMARKRTFRGTRKERFPTFPQRINLSQQRLYKPPTRLYPYKKNEKSHTFTTKTKVKSARHALGVLHFIFVSHH